MKKETLVRDTWSTRRSKDNKFNTKSNKTKQLDNQM